MPASYYWPIESTKMKKIYNFSTDGLKNLEKGQNQPFWKFGFLAKIWKKIIWNQNSVISYGPLHVSYYENFWIKSNLRKWKKHPHFKLKSNCDTVGIQQNPASHNPFGKFCLGIWIYFQFFSIFVATRRYLGEGIQKMKFQVSCQ